jgi:hypothetical protein
MKPRGTLIHLLLGLLLASTPARAYADGIPLEGFGPFPFGPGDILRGEFDAGGFLAADREGHDVLVVSPGVSVVDPVESFTTRIYDGEHLLGTYTSTPADQPGFRAWFAAPGSMFTFGNPAHMDFSTLQNGTFNGRFEFEIQGGFVNLFRVSDELDFDKALTPTVASGIGFAPRTYELVPAPEPVPEPASLLLIGSSFLLLRVRTRVARSRQHVLFAEHVVNRNGDSRRPREQIQGGNLWQ